MSFDWNEHLEPLLKMYGKRRHPLDYKNRYQLVIMVILSAQDSDQHINELAGRLFAAYPSLKDLVTSTPDELIEFIGSVKNYRNKAQWMVKLAGIVGDDGSIPETLAELTKLPGIGRKSANVIIRESGGRAEGIIVDLHVMRVAPRIGMAEGDKPEKIEKQLMAIIPEKRWNEAGMALSFLGREICRPANPKCTECVMSNVCRYYNDELKKTGKFR